MGVNLVISGRVKVEGRGGRFYAVFGPCSLLVFFEGRAPLFSILLTSSLKAFALCLPLVSLKVPGAETLANCNVEAEATAFVALFVSCAAICDILVLVLVSYAFMCNMALLTSVSPCVTTDASLCVWMQSSASRSFVL